MRGNIDRLPSECLDRFYFDITVFDPDLIGHLVDRFGADRVLLGTDYPFDMGLTDPLGALADTRLDQQQRAMIAGGNAASLFRIASRAG
jgi:aminocarboxymuconate-semialdehyde decarboxylase